MDSAIQTLWRAACGGLARLNQALVAAEAPDDAVFHAPPAVSSPAVDGRVAEARRHAAAYGQRR